MSAIAAVRIAQSSHQRGLMLNIWNVVSRMIQAGQIARVEVLDGDERSLAQNDKMWAMLADISRQVNWHGSKLSPEEWKHVFSAAIEQQKVVPNLDGTGFVVLGCSTRRKSKKWFSDLFELMNAFGVERDVRFSDAARADCWADKKAGQKLESIAYGTEIDGECRVVDEVAA